MNTIPKNIGKAIWAVDAALWAATGTPLQKPLRQARLILAAALTASGYEFAKNDSMRVRRIKR